MTRSVVSGEPLPRCLTSRNGWSQLATAELGPLANKVHNPSRDITLHKANQKSKSAASMKNVINV